MRRHAHPWHRRFRHSLKWRLVALFFVLAAALAALFFSGSRQAFSAGWRELMRPLVSDYVDRLAAEVGSPPDAARARALVARLPLHLRIDGPALQFDNQPEAWRGHRERLDATADGLLVRHTADGHVLRFGVSLPSWEDRPRWVVGSTLAGLLLLVFAAFAYVRHLFRPLDDIRAGALRYGQGDFTQPIPVRRRDELGDLAAQVNTMAGELGRMLQGQRALLLAISHELRSPLTRARLNAELVPEGAERDALLRDLGAMRDLITDLLESERLAAGSSALQREPTDLDQLVRELVAREFDDRAPALHLQLWVIARWCWTARGWRCWCATCWTTHGATAPARRSRRNWPPGRMPMACGSRFATMARVCPRTSWRNWPSRSTAQIRPAPATAAAWAWAWPCAGPWRARTAAIWCSATRSPDWRFGCACLETDAAGGGRPQGDGYSSRLKERWAAARRSAAKPGSRASIRRAHSITSSAVLGSLLRADSSQLSRRRRAPTMASIALEAQREPRGIE